MWHFLLASFPSAWIFLFSVARSWDHHLLAKGEGLDIGTTSWIVLVMMSVSWSSCQSASLADWIRRGHGSCLSRWLSISLNFSQSVIRKLCLGGEFISSGVNMHLVMMGKWSVFTGVSSLGTLHWVMASSIESEQKTLSGRVKFFDALAWSVGLCGGSAMCRSWVARMSSRGWAAVIFAAVKRWWLLGSSHRG